ncbi:hypothetical protein K474DRAFT_614030 [Panus rudis PR-1116 ss-1]|nr:hypothetical protein K474DRAFT_614030 [Panus rudis PR-1116 ss-1]
MAGMQIQELQLGIISQILVLVEDCLTVIFTTYKTLQTRREAVAIGIEVPPLSALLLRDGCLEFLGLLVFNIINIIQISFTGSSSVIISLVHLSNDPLGDVHSTSRLNLTTHFASTLVHSLHEVVDVEEMDIEISGHPLAASRGRLSWGSHRRDPERTT